MIKTASFRHVLVPILLILGAAEAQAHVPPLAYVSMTLDDVELVHQLTIRADLLADWTGLDAGRWRPPEGEVSVPLTEADREALAEAHATWLGVTVDGIEVTAVVRDAVSYDIMDHQSTYSYLNVTLAYGTLGRAKQVEFLWRRFDTTILGTVSPVDAEMDAYGTMDYSSFTRKEPGWIWHAPLETGERGKTIVAPPLPVPATVGFSILSAVLGLLALVAIPVVLVRRVRPLRALAVIAVPLLAATATWGTTRAEVELPWGGGYSMPTEAEAAATFAELHRNIYRAFKFTNEDAIYETLARTVEGDLLDEVYAEVYQSLILRDEGGAVCVVHGTDMLETEVTLPDDSDARRFDVICRWRVKGTVEHYGHKHVRMNEYRARYTVRWRDGGWKISDAETLGQKRVGLDE